MPAHKLMISYNVATQTQQLLISVSVISARVWSNACTCVLGCFGFIHALYLLLGLISTLDMSWVWSNCVWIRSGMPG